MQLNYGYGIDECREAVDVLEADALYLHLNPLQEAIQAEGNCDFSGLAGKIGEVVAALDRPVVLKEVGCGVSPSDLALAYDNGVLRPELIVFNNSVCNFFTISGWSA